MLRLKVEGWENLRELIDTNDLVDSGIDSSPHITLVFGLNSISNVEEIKTHLANSGLIGTKIPLTSASAFRNENDVLNYSISDPKIYSKLKFNHLKLSTSMDSKLTHKDYKPHVTVAYVKSGTVDKYLDKLPKLEGEITNFWYSTTFKL